MSSSRLVSRISRSRPISQFLSHSAQIRSPARILARSVSDVAGPPAAPSFLSRAASSTGRALLFFAIGFIMAAAPAYTVVQTLGAKDTDTLSMFTAQTDEEREKENFINALSMVASLRANPDMIESRPHMKIPPAWRAANLTGGALMGPGKMVVPPFGWAERGGKSYVQIFHVGKDLCGHVGVVHGGFLATVLDEGLARCCFDALPHKIGMTAKLEVNYKAPAMADQYLVLRSETTKVEGRKAWVEGRIETLPEEGKEPKVLATASALYISPKTAPVMAKIYSSSSE